MISKHFFFLLDVAANTAGFRVDDSGLFAGAWFQQGSYESIEFNNVASKHVRLKLVGFAGELGILFKRKCVFKQFVEVCIVMVNLNKLQECLLPYVSI